jgi:hypothetical protein
VVYNKIKKEKIVKFNIEINQKDNPNEVGEMLRNKFFKDLYNTLTTGFVASCNGEKLETIPLDKEYPDDHIKWTRYSCYINNVQIEVRYFWDMDIGTLMFLFPDGSCITNNMLPDRYKWAYHESEKEWLYQY